MNFTVVFAFILFFCTTGICKARGYDFDACPTNPNHLLNVTFASLDVQCSVKYDLKYFTQPPRITFTNAVQDKYYEVLMIDPDAPSAENHKCRSWIHMIFSDVKGSDLQKGISARDGAGIVVTEYNPPGPPRGTGYHRYIQAIFSHSEPLKIKNKITERCGFDIDLFTKTHNLSPTPDASNMFKTITK